MGQLPSGRFANPDLIYAAANANGNYGDVFKTKDGGANWIRTGNRTDESTVMSLDPEDSNSVYLGDYGSGGQGDAWLDRSVDGASTWRTWRAAMARRSTASRSGARTANCKTATRSVSLARCRIAFRSLLVLAPKGA